MIVEGRTCFFIESIDVINGKLNILYLQMPNKNMLSNFTLYCWLGIPLLGHGFKTVLKIQTLPVNLHDDETVVKRLYCDNEVRSSQVLLYFLRTSLYSLLYPIWPFWPRTPWPNLCRLLSRFRIYVKQTDQALYEVLCLFFTQFVHIDWRKNFLFWKILEFWKSICLPTEN